MATAIRTRKKPALSEREAMFLDRFKAAQRLLVTPGLTHREMVQHFMDQYPQETEKQARRWLARVREDFRDSEPLDPERGKREYAGRLEWLLGVCRPHLVKDEVEVTVLEADPEGTDKSKSEKEPKKYKTKVKKNAINTQLVGHMLRIMRELAYVTGARPKENNLRLNLTKNNNLNVISGANAIGEASAAELLAEMGLALPASAPTHAAGHRPHEAEPDDVIVLPPDEEDQENGGRDTFQGAPHRSVDPGGPDGE